MFSPYTPQRSFSSELTSLLKDLTVERGYNANEADGSSNGQNVSVTSASSPIILKTFDFSNLPTELKAMTISFLDVLEVLSLSLTAKEYYELCKRPIVWKYLCMKTWKELRKNYDEYENPRVQGVDWQRYYYFRSVFLSTPAHLEWRSNPEGCLATLPSSRQSLSGTYVDGKVIYIGGQTSVTARFDDVYYFDPETLEFSKPKIVGHLPKFARHTAVSIEHTLYIFGGYDGFGTFFGLATFDTRTKLWSYPRTTGNPPIPRTNHAVTAIGSKMYLFGGNDTTRAPTDEFKHGTYGDFLAFDTETLHWSEPETTGTPPCPRSGHHMLAIGTKLYLFGGGLWNDKNKMWLERYNDMYVLDTETMRWEEVPQVTSPPQAFISLPHWVIDNFIFVYNDPLWCFDTLTGIWTMLTTTGARPSKRFLGPATVVEKSHSVFMFGGVYTSVINYLDQLVWPKSIYKVFLDSKSSH